MIVVGEKNQIDFLQVKGDGSAPIYQANLCRAVDNAVVETFFKPIKAELI